MESRILDVLREFALRLGLTYYSPSKIIWARFDPVFGTVPIDIDEPLVRRDVVFHERLQDLLSEDQLEALAASILVRHSGTRVARSRRVLLSTILSVIATAILGFVFLPILLPEDSPYYCYRSSEVCGHGPFGYIVAWTLLPVIVVSAVLILRFYFRRRTIVSDRLTAELMGRERLLNALKAIEAAAPPMPSKRIGPDWEYVKRMPFVKRRIKALEKLGAYPSTA